MTKNPPTCQNLLRTNVARKGPVIKTRRVTAEKQYHREAAAARNRRHEEEMDDPRLRRLQTIMLKPRTLAVAAAPYID